MSAGVSALCFGLGIGMLFPAVQLLLRERKSLAEVFDPVSIRVSSASPLLADSLRSLASYLPSGPVPSFLLVMVAIGCLAVAGGLAEYTQQRAVNLVILDSAKQLRSRLFQQFLCLTTERILREGNSPNLSRMVTDVGLVSRAHQLLLGRPILEALKGIAGLSVAFLLDWRLTLAAVASAPLIALPLRYFARTTHAASQRALAAQARMVGVLQQALLALPVVKVFGANRYEESKFEVVNESLLEQEKGIASTNAAAGSLVETVSVLVVTAVTAGAAVYVFRSGIDPAEFITALIALFAAAQGLRPLNRIVQGLAEARAAVERLDEVLQAEVEDSIPHAGRPVLARHHDSIVFDAVSYTYPGRSKPALDRVSLEIRHGQTVVLTGANGSGKTSLISLLPRLIDPCSGKVLIDGVDIRTVSLFDLRRQIALVPQETVLLGGTIAENIAYGLSDVSRSEIHRAAELTGIDQLIASLPGGYDCVLGELGSGLSSGQKQRLAIARAILRDPAILILDEATSQVDSDSAVRIRTVLQQARQGRTVIVVTHDQSAVEDPDLVVDLRQGRVANLRVAAMRPEKDSHALPTFPACSPLGSDSVLSAGNEPLAPCAATDLRGN